MAKTVLEGLRVLRNEAEARLRQNEDYRALVALEEAIRKLELPGTAATFSTPGLIIPVVAPTQVGRIVAPPTIQGSRISVTAAAMSAGVSQGDAAHLVLSERGEPVPVVELLDHVRAEGAVVEGKRPHINLSSTLSRDKRFRTVRYEGRPAWWLADRPFPGEIDMRPDEGSQNASAGQPSKQDPAEAST